MPNSKQHQPYLLQQVLAYLCDGGLDDELDAVLENLAVDVNCDGLFLLRVTQQRRHLVVEAMSQTQGAKLSRKDAERLLTRLANHRRLHSYASLKTPCIVDDLNTIIDDDLAIQSQLDAVQIRSALLMPISGIDTYILGAYRYDCDEPWHEDKIEALRLASHLVAFKQELIRQRSIVSNNELVCAEHLYRLPMPCAHIDIDNKVVRFNVSAEETLHLQAMQEVLTLVNRRDEALLLDTMQLVRGQVLEQASCELVIKPSPSPAPSRLTFLSLSGEEGPLLMFIEPIEEQLATAPPISLHFDGLTGLPNRSYFEALYTQAKPNRQGRSTFVAFINLDRFQIVNNVSGHKAGDRLLCEVAARLGQLVRKDDVVARLSGDEFGILMPDIDMAIAQQVAQRICHALSEHEFVWNERKHSVSISLGLARCDVPEESISELLRSASAACRIAKEKGRNGWYLYQADDPTLDRLNTDMSASVDIIGALSKDQFELYFQPIEPLMKESEGLHLEILLRMISDDGELIAPGIFLPAAERFNLASKVDKWVIDHLLRWGAEHLSLWQAMSMISVNLSALSIGDKEFIDWLEMRLLGEPELVGKLCFEITETAAVSQLDHATELINLVKPMGCKLALDDFGSGFSSFAYLKLLDVDFVKIDGQFVQNLCEDKADQAIVNAIVQLGRDMEFEIIAEFVESVAVGRHLKELGVDYGQGYGIAKPSSLNGLTSGKSLAWYQQLS
ncbi:EAL domain-containing protein [Shewanella colwelliana]|uniref:putative bifunctional diguanylate cyclase/phosphodiesterase n=1 Tax=Shewanella colwelliana TaxID=23 RepID=UPI00299E5951|nr:EAL domain-containing protein [Shewanella colwelliana]MDX1279633.1 EAL domain-containing protein [Shewanella colwelliana]